MKITEINQNSNLNISSDFILNSIDNYIKVSKFPKNIQLQKLQILLEKNKKLENDISAKIDEFNKLIIKNTKINNELKSKNIENIQKLSASI